MDCGELSWRERGRLWLRLGIRLVLLILGLLGLRYLAPPLLSLLMPFVLALIMAWLLNPLVRMLQKRLHISRGILSLLLILLVFAGVGGVLFAFGRSIFTEVRSLVENWQSIWESAQYAIISVGDFFDRVFAYLPQGVEHFLNENVERLLDWVKTALPEFLTGMAGRAGNFAMSIPSFVVALIVFIMGTYFITADYPHIRFMVTDRMPDSARALWSKVKHTALGAFGGYVRAEVIISAGVFFILLVGFLLIGQGYSILLALLLAVVDFIPIIGSGTFMVPWAIVDIAMGDWRHAIGLMVIWGVVCLFRRLAEPKAVGSQTGLSPILSLVSMYAGMKLAGVLGMILGPIVCLVAINICKTGIFDGIVDDLRLAVTDLAALLRNRPKDPMGAGKK